MGENEMREYKGKIRLTSRVKGICIALVVGIAVGAVGGWIAHKTVHDMLNKEAEVTVEYVTGKLENIGELATQEITYTSRVPIEKVTIPFITKKGFTMEYNATLKAGVQMEKMEILPTKEKVIVTIPHAEVLGTAHVDPNSIQFVDEKKAILNWNNQEDVAEALAKAEADIEENPAIDLSLLLERADENIEELIHTILDDSVGGLEVEVKFKN